MAKIIYKTDPDANKSDQDLLNEILDQYQEFEEALEDVMEGLINPLIVRGPPGVGKSESVEIAAKQKGIVSKDWILSEWKERSDNTGSRYPYELDKEILVKGALMRGADYSNWALNVDFYANSSEGMICIDDNDTILKCPIALAILMKATEQKIKSQRVISYPKAASTHELQLRGIPSSYTVNTPIVILSNIDFDLHIRHGKMKEEETGRPMPAHIARWEALMQSRGKYIDLQMNSPRRVRIWCEYLIQKTHMLTRSAWLKEKGGRALTARESQTVMDWVRHNQTHLKTRLDLRTYNKVALKLIKKQKQWEKSAQVDFLRVV